jgi:hypothetical protein
MALACPSFTSGTKSVGKCSFAPEAARLNNPLRFASGDTNFYRWVFNNPVNLTDPSGLSVYRDNFVRQTPHMPPYWAVHHTLQQAPGLKDRLMRERGIDVDDVRHLRGVDPTVHDDIKKMQDIWAERQMRKLGILADYETFTTRKYPELWKRVALDDVLAFQRDMDEVYKHHWIKVGACEVEVAQVQKRIGTTKRMNLFRAGQGNRAAKLFRGLGEKLSVIALIGSTYSFAQGAGMIGPHTPAQNDAWQEFMSHYQSGLDEGLTGTDVSQNTAMSVHQSFIRYLQAINTPEDAVTQIDRDLSLHFSSQR